MSDSPVEKATGESARGLIVMVVGAAAIAAIVAPFLSNMLRIGMTAALVLAGAALAYFGKGWLRKAGQGAVVTAVFAFVMPYVTGLIGNLTGGLFGGGAAASSGGATPQGHRGVI